MEPRIVARRSRKRFWRDFRCNRIIFPAPTGVNTAQKIEISLNPPNVPILNRVEYGEETSAYTVLELISTSVTPM